MGARSVVELCDSKISRVTISERLSSLAISSFSSLFSLKYVHNNYLKCQKIYQLKYSLQEIYLYTYLNFIVFGFIFYDGSTRAIEDYYIILAKQNVISC